LNTEIRLSEHRTEEPTEFMQLVSNTTTYISFGIPSAILVKGILSHDKMTRQKSFFMFESLGISTAITFAAKYTFNRKRPFEATTLVTKASPGGGPSFPSGHTSEAFSTATSLSILYPRWYVIVPSFVWAGTVGYSRMYLGVHYPTDILAGALVGCGSAFLCYKLNKWIHAEKMRKKIIHSL
jgi:undecaprenyl-diphosphatase